MNAIEKLIFNELASRRGVNFPGVGSLCPEFRPARLRSKKILEAPSVHVVFSHDESSAWPSLPALIAREGEMDGEIARAEYDRWLHGAQKKQTIVINGTGEIQQGHFVPSPELNALLNPKRPPFIRLRKRRKSMRVALGMLVAVLAICLVVAVWLYHDAFRLPALLALVEHPSTIMTPEPYPCGEPATQIDTTEKAENPTETTPPESPATVIVPDSLPCAEEPSIQIDTTGKAEISTETIPPEEPPATVIVQEPHPSANIPAIQIDTTGKAETPAKTITTETLSQNKESSEEVTLSAPEGKSHYLIAGVFSTEGNADRFIATIRTKKPSDTFQKILTPNGKIMVSVFSSKERIAVERRLKELTFTYLDCWIFDAR